MGSSLDSGSLDLTNIKGAVLTDVPGTPGIVDVTGVEKMVGAAMLYTPKSSSITVIMDGTVGTFGTQGSGVIGFYYGTGAAPANKAAVTGTNIVKQNYDFATTAGNTGFMSFSKTRKITGLTPGVPIWLDFSLNVNAIGTGVAEIFVPHVTVIE